jgi:hypothetical protein
MTGGLPDLARWIAAGADEGFAHRCGLEVATPIYVSQLRKQLSAEVIRQAKNPQPHRVRERALDVRAERQ